MGSRQPSLGGCNQMMLLVGVTCVPLDPSHAQSFAKLRWQDRPTTVIIGMRRSYIGSRLCFETSRPRECLPKHAAADCLPNPTPAVRGTNVILDPLAGRAGVNSRRDRPRPWLPRRRQRRGRAHLSEASRPLLARAGVVSVAKHLAYGDLAVEAKRLRPAVNDPFAARLRIGGQAA
jgi:hypothetical protein